MIAGGRAEQTNAKSKFATISVTFLVLPATAKLSTTRFSHKTNNNLRITLCRISLRERLKKLTVLVLSMTRFGNEVREGLKKL